MTHTEANPFFHVYELDIVRVVAAAAIILTHLSFFFPINMDLRMVFYIFGTCGLTAFFFLSGFFVAKDRFTNNKEIVRFWKKKSVRILPVMYVAAVFYIIIEYLNLGSTDWNIPLNIWSVLSNFLCLQVFFYDLRFFALWYIGTLFLLYIIHILVQRISHDDIFYYIIFSVLFFIPLILLYFIHLPIYGYSIETRIIDYYFVFFLGSLSGLIIKNKVTKMFVYPLGILFGFIVLQEIAYLAGYGYKIFILYLPTFITVLGLILFILMVNIKIYDPISSLPKTIQMASYATYSTYLFHYPILCLLAIIGLQNQYIFIFISIPLVFIMGYILQYGIEKIFNGIVNHIPHSTIKQ